jgi:hypothetical protein
MAGESLTPYADVEEKTYQAAVAILIAASLEKARIMKEDSGKSETTEVD